jgi:hypothetical protein
MDANSDSDMEESEDEDIQTPKKRGKTPRIFQSSDSPKMIKEKFKGKKTKDRTKSNYKGKLGQIELYFQKIHPEALVEGKLEAPIPAEPLLDFFSYIFIGAHERGKLNGPNDIPDKEPDPFSSSQIKGYRSAVVYLYTQKLMKIDPELDGELTAMIEGYDKVINELKRRGLMKPGEGKSALKFQGYEFLSAALAKLKPANNGSWSLCVFMWSYFTLLWNLMSRSDSVDTLMEEHFDWEGDAMKIQEQGHKSDATGKEKYWKHVYANPLNPFICPVLALAVHIFSIAAHSTNINHKIYDGTNSKDRFGRNLSSTLSKCWSESCT